MSQYFEQTSDLIVDSVTQSETEQGPMYPVSLRGTRKGLSPEDPKLNGDAIYEKKTLLSRWIEKKNPNIRLGVLTMNDWNSLYRLAGSNKQDASTSHMPYFASEVPHVLLYTSVA